MRVWASTTLYDSRCPKFLQSDCRISLHGRYRQRIPQLVLFHILCSLEKSLALMRIPLHTHSNNQNHDSWQQLYRNWLYIGLRNIMQAKTFPEALDQAIPIK